MAMYKTYARRRESGKRLLWICLGCILAAFLFAVALGAYLGGKVAPAAPYVPPELSDEELRSGFTDRLELRIHGKYFDPGEKFVLADDDPYAAASFWIYRDGAPTFALETDRLLGRQTEGLADKGKLKSDISTSGLFEVGSLYAPDAVRPVYAAYENAVLSEYARTALGEIVLVFREVRPGDIDEMFALAASLPCRVTVCVPYSILESDLCTAFFTAADGFGTALYAEGVKPKKLAEDLNTYAFYFTKFDLRFLLTAADAPLTETLTAAGLLNYQFVTPGADAAESKK